MGGKSLLHMPPKPSHLTVGRENLLELPVGRSSGALAATLHHGVVVLLLGRTLSATWLLWCVWVVTIHPRWRNVSAWLERIPSLSTKKILF